jgi:hypothetical protein
LCISCSLHCYFGCFPFEFNFHFFKLKIIYFAFLSFPSLFSPLAPAQPAIFPPLPSPSLLFPPGSPAHGLFSLFPFPPLLSFPSRVQPAAIARGPNQPQPSFLPSSPFLPACSPPARPGYFSPRSTSRARPLPPSLSLSR